MTFDRRGHRRLGAFLGGEVVDLPDLVGHPAFPTTMEALVKGNGGTVLDAARAALERDEAEDFLVPDFRLLAPLLPESLRSREALEADRPVLGPDDDVPWPAGAGWLDYGPKVVAVVGRPGRDLEPEPAGQAVFGYTLVNDWTARDASGNPAPSTQGLPLSLGPCIITADEVDPQTMYVTARVDGDEWAKGNLNGTARNLLQAIGRASRGEDLRSGDAFASDPFGGGFGAGPERRLWPGALVELEAEGIGTLRNRVGPRR